MSRQTGFTLVELMVTLAIVGILMATAIPVFQTWQQRAYGQEATLMAKQILDGQILYYLENDDFYPAVGDDFFIPMATPPSPETVTRLENTETALKIQVPVGHQLNYQFVNNGPLGFMVTISANFNIFKGNFNALNGYIDTSGNVTLFPVNIPGT